MHPFLLQHVDSLITVFGGLFCTYIGHKRAASGSDSPSLKLLRVLGPCVIIFGLLNFFNEATPKSQRRNEGPPDGNAAAEFTRYFAEALRHARPNMKVVIVKDLELKITSADGRDLTSFLDNAYDTYKLDPKAKADVIQRFVASALETADGVRDGVDRTRIVPVIKDRPWLEETRQALLARGAKDVPEHVFEDFSPDLVVLYAEDSPNNIRYLGAKDLELANIDRSELRALATDNLKRLLPKIERRGSNGLYMLTAGGNYEASLLVLDSIWSAGNIDVQGDIVVAIPARDLLLVTGSRDPSGIEKVKQMVRNEASGGAYRLTSKLFVYRHGRFDEFKEGDEVESP